MQVDLPTSAGLSQAEQFAMLQKIAGPEPAMRAKRAVLAYRLDLFEEALADYRAIPDDALTADMLLGTARLLRKLGADHFEEAARLLARAKTSARSTAASHEIAIEHAALCRAQSENAQARALLLEVLAIKPDHTAALRKYVAIAFDDDDADGVLQLCESLLECGVNHTRLIGSLFTALAALGRLEEARELRGFDRFMQAVTVDLPDRDALHTEVIAQLKGHPALRFGNSGQASEESWRVDELAVRQSPAIMQLLSAIREEIHAYLTRLTAGGEEADHLWRRAMPAAARIQAWAILAPANGRETWHTHDGGWLSGVYYLKVPQDLPRGNDPAGAIEFGWPERLLGEGAAERLGNHFHHPQEGDLLLFPSHAHHRTWPHGCAEDRICVAFDVVPAD